MPRCWPHCHHPDRDLHGPRTSPCVAPRVAPVGGHGDWSLITMFRGCSLWIGGSAIQPPGGSSAALDCDAVCFYNSYLRIGPTGVANRRRGTTPLLSRPSVAARWWWPLRWRALPNYLRPTVRG
jgi:hypothetical protein